MAISPILRPASGGFFRRTIRMGSKFLVDRITVPTNTSHCLSRPRGNTPSSIWWFLATISILPRATFIHTILGLLLCFSFCCGYIFFLVEALLLALSYTIYRHKYSGCILPYRLFTFCLGQFSQENTAH